MPTLTVDETHLCDRRLGLVCGPVHVGAFGNDGFKDADNNDIEDADAISYALGISAPVRPAV